MTVIRFKNHEIDHEFSSVCGKINAIRKQNKEE
ncbi:MAG: hypothetical protein II877_05800 [Synergistaceae bacterium]|nr:hypothetical protein [Synergistaceae bacterium]MBQ7168722.1 hypothetical protein [Synergistaceae bacterium]